MSRGWWIFTATQVVVGAAIIIAFGFAAFAVAVVYSILGSLATVYSS